MMLQVSGDDPYAVLRTLPEALPSQPLLHLAITRRVSNASSSGTTTHNKGADSGIHPLWTSEAVFPPSITSSLQATEYKPSAVLPTLQALSASSPLAHWQQNSPSEPLAAANMTPETVISTTPDRPARQRFIAVQETRRETYQVLPITSGGLEYHSPTPPTWQALDKSRLEQLSQNSLQDSDTSSEHRAPASTVFCSLNNHVNSAWSQAFVNHVIRTRTLLATSSYELILPMSMDCDYVRTATQLVISFYTPTSAMRQHNDLFLFADGMKHTRNIPEHLFAILLLYVHYCVVHRLNCASASRFLAYQLRQGIALEKYPLPRHDADENNQILLEIEKLQQIVCGAGGEASLVVGQIAATYQLAAQLLVYIRLFGYTPSHETVCPKVSELTELLFQLPTEASPLHRAMDPLFSVVVCFCLTVDEDVANRLLDRSLGLRRGMKSDETFMNETTPIRHSEDCHHDWALDEIWAQVDTDIDEKGHGGEDGERGAEKVGDTQGEEEAKEENKDSKKSPRLDDKDQARKQVVFGPDIPQPSIERGVGEGASGDGNFFVPENQDAEKSDADAAFVDPEYGRPLFSLPEPGSPEDGETVAWAKGNGDGKMFINRCGKKSAGTYRVNNRALSPKYETTKEQKASGDGKIMIRRIIAVAWTNSNLQHSTEDLELIK
ncbi:hypothetical protein J7T55_000237, partial [Diaporthe amygdali]|uniref:uncharacterized protein n=1 Tax=Phomopsis amygdali TaxID=1214568 RepID=UPI0022FEA5EF